MAQTSPKCPNLVSLTVDVQILYDCSLASISKRVPVVSRTTLLTRIEIKSTGLIDASVLTPLFGHSPRLRELALDCNHFSIEDIGTILGSRCPRLVHLQLGFLVFLPSSIVNEIKKSKIDNDIYNDGQLQSLTLGCGIRSAIPLAFRLEKSIYTLQALSIVMDIIPTNVHNSTLLDWTPFSQFIMYSLTYFSISSPCHTSIDYQAAPLTKT